jgi:hypothetical protein
MMRAKERGLWEIAANHNVRLPGALTGKRRRETSLDSKATQLLRANEMTRWVILDRLTRSHLPAHVCFAPKATDVLRCREMTRR